jgi:lipopolysaccharide/colanic/teichoic acid biosynthesis glycosyltransferase
MWYATSKRLFDIVCASVGLLVLVPVGLLIGLLIELSDRGPVFFGQTRIGQFGKPFRIWKFRSMVVNADKVGIPITREEDPRITWIGRFLRKTKLDELPQLWNVLVGEMSFVGPRPEVPRYVERYTPEQREILKYKPGITDVATLLFRNEEALLRGTADVEGFYLQYCLPKKIELNRQHAERSSLLRDIGLIWQTVLVLSFGALGRVRMPFRLFRESFSKSKSDSPAGVWRVAIIGTGELAANLALDFARSAKATRRVVAFFDDNPHTWHKRPHDIPVMGMPECLLNREWIDKIDEVVVALPEEDPARLATIGEMLKSLPLKVTFASAWPVLNTDHGPMEKLKVES